MYLVILSVQRIAQETHLYHSEQNAISKYVELAKQFDLASIRYDEEYFEECLHNKIAFMDLVADVNNEPNMVRQIKFLEVQPEDIAAAENNPPAEVQNY